MGTIKKVFWDFECTWDYYDENLHSKINEIYQRRFSSYIVLISVTYQCNLPTPAKKLCKFDQGLYSQKHSLKRGKFYAIEKNFITGQSKV